jgi:NAD(P)H-dependent FMN reductase
MLEAVIDGANDPRIEGVEVHSIDALSATSDDVGRADALILGTPENFGYMSGALKYFFDNVFYEVLDVKRGLPYGLFVKAGHDGSGAVGAIEPLANGLGWRRVTPPVVAVGELTPEHLDACTELGATIAAGLAYGGL